MLLRCEGINVSLGTSNSTPVLSDISFVARHGELLTVLGPSGCGKTTLLRTIAGLVPPSRGYVRFEPAPGDRNKAALLVFQENSLFPWMTALQNAAFGLKAKGVGRAEREAAALVLLNRFGLSGYEHRYPKELSVGMKQRVAVIRCFLSDPAVMLMDEPFAALDPRTRLHLQEELLWLWERNQKTVIFVTHDIEEAILLSDRILIMDQRPGRIVAQIAVPFERPRKASLTLTDEFLALKREVWAKFEDSLADCTWQAQGAAR
jgi:NitT/TauT family transport system ATP-binding protein